MSEEKFQDEGFNASEYWEAHDKEYIKKLEVEIKELRTRIASMQSTEMPWTKGFDAGWHNRDKEVDMLRTRVAELEAEAKMGNIPYREAVELKKRVAELDGLKAEYASMSERYVALVAENERLNRMTHNDICQQLIVAQNSCVEYAKRVAELEMIHKQCLLRDAERLSTLLKASEGMEKALEEIVRMKGICPVSAPIAEQALADFRAVKETMEKGEGK